MTIEQEFYKCFEIEKRCLHPKECRHKGICRGVVACDHYTYPPFTAEKQIELIKWLAEHKNDFGLFYSMNYRTNKNEWWACCDKKYEDFTEAHHDTNFEQALTGLINSIWEHLSPEEKEQIRDILAR